MPEPTEKLPDYTREYIFEMTFDEIQSNFKSSKYWKNSS